MPEGAALSWSFSDIVIRRKGRLAFRYRVPGCSLLDQWPEAALYRRSSDARHSAAVAPTTDLAWKFTEVGGHSLTHWIRVGFYCSGRIHCFQSAMPAEVDLTLSLPGL